MKQVPDLYFMGIWEQKRLIFGFSETCLKKVSTHDIHDPLVCTLCPYAGLAVWYHKLAALCSSFIYSHLNLSRNLKADLMPTEKNAFKVNVQELRDRPSSSMIIVLPKRYKARIKLASSHVPEALANTED